MFDEAFNNMDESRIEAMMEYYNELKYSTTDCCTTSKARQYCAICRDNAWID